MVKIGGDCFKMNSKFKKVLVYLANGLGNCVLAIPALKSLRLLAYDVDVAIPGEWPAAKPLVELFDGQSFINKVIQDKHHVCPDDYDVIFIPNTHEKSELRCFLEEFGHSVVVQSPKFWRKTFVHESEYLMMMPRSLGYRGPAPDIRILTSEPKLLPRKPYITLAFSCKEGSPWSLKRWPGTHWIALISILLDKLPDHEFVFIGSNGDRSEAQEIVSGLLSDRVQNMCGFYSVTESACVISNSMCLITIDNGISHLAAATHVRNIIVLYGATLLSKNIPLHDNVHVIRSDILCAPCFNSKVFNECKNNICMQLISPESVADCLFSCLQVS
jgi:ADP-heptose:LPS heptosyltransferase